jgi:hypothetical protein
MCDLCQFGWLWHAICTYALSALPPRRVGKGLEGDKAGLRAGPRSWDEGHSRRQRVEPGGREKVYLAPGFRAPAPLEG